MTLTSLLGDLRVLYHLTLAPVRGRTHSERLESFYANQSADYDRFRRKLLHGREELISMLPLVSGSTWVDLGGRPRVNKEAAGKHLANLSQVMVVDLSPSLLRRAEERIQECGWQNVKTCLADATEFVPTSPADIVTCSYSLTMIPDRFAAIKRAWEMLRPGGVIGVVDFYVSRKYPAQGRRRHGWFSRTMLPAWFAGDNVNLSSDHLPFLERQFETLTIHERRGKIPWAPFMTAPYYLFLGRKA